MVNFNTQSFEKYVIHKDYHITQHNANGTTTEIRDQKEISDLLDSDKLAGSIAITRDTKHVGWAHKLIYYGQLIQSKLFGRSHNLDANLCHSMILLGAPKQKKEGEKHPFLLAHSAFEGVCTSKHDYLADNDVTEIVVYRPVDEKIRQLFQEHCDQTAYVGIEKLRKPISPEVKSTFSFGGLVRSFFLNRKHKVCNMPPKIAMERTAYVVADLLLGNQLLDKEGKPKSFFCSAYATSVLQGTFIINDLQIADERARTQFLKAADGAASLNRKELAEKILGSFSNDNGEEFSKTLHNAYQGKKIARLDGSNIMSAYLAKTLDKLTVGKPYYQAKMLEELASNSQA